MPQHQPLDDHHSAVSSDGSWTTVDSSRTPLHKPHPSSAPSAAHHLSEEGSHPSNWQIRQQQQSTKQQPPSTSHTLPVKSDSSLEIEQVSTTSSGGISWARRMPWMRSKKNSRRQTDKHVNSDMLDYQTGEATYYHGATMEAFPDYPARQQQTSQEHAAQVAAVANALLPTSKVRHGGGLSAPKRTTSPPAVSLNRTSSFSRVSSWLHASSYADESLVDFHDSEWTPPDSSYGAAIPVGGWIPKPIRRLIECTIVGAIISGLIYMVITTSIRLRGEGDSSGMYLDDDRYIAYNANGDDVVTDDGVGDQQYDDFVGDDDALYSNNHRDDDAYKQYYDKSDDDYTVHYYDGYESQNDDDGNRKWN